ncbi:MAG: hypothetical protein QXI60_05330 [Thermofilaceae archaeon]
MPSSKSAGTWRQKYTDVPPGTIPVTRHTYQRVGDIERELIWTNVGPEIRPLTKDAAPFFYLISNIRKEVVYDTQFRWVSDDYAPGYVQNTTDETTPGATLTLATGHGSRLLVNDLLYVARTSERLRVTAIAGDTITVTRNWDGALAAPVALANGDILIQTGYAAPEGDVAPNMLRTTKRIMSNNTQRFWASVGETGTAAAIKLVTGEIGELSRLEAKMVTFLHMSIERAFLFGGDKDDSANSGVTSTAGVLDLLGYRGGTTADCPVVDMNAGFSLNALIDFAKEVSYYDDSPRVLLSSPEFMSFLFKGLASLTSTPYRWTFDGGDDVFKLGWSTLDLGFIQFKIVKAPALKVDGTPAGSGNAANRRVRAIALALDELAYVHLPERDGVRFVMEMPNEQHRDARLISLLYECGLKLWNPEKHGIILA